jgi:hypothetical protein
MPAHRRLSAGAIAGLALFGVICSPAASAHAAPAPAPAATTAVAGSAPAAPRAFSLYAPSTLTLTIGLGEDTDSVQRAVSLRCLPIGGDHPDPTAACTALTEADGDIAAVPSTSGACTREYRPVTATAQGVWRGRLTSFRETYSNACVLARQVGPVFNF